MSTVTLHCSACGSAISQGAKFCPGCGLELTARAMRVEKEPLLSGLQWFVLVVGIGIVIISAISMSSTDSAPNSSPDSAAAALPQSKRDSMFNTAFGGAVILRNAMRDPMSFYVSNANLMPDGSVCYEFRSRNGFGGMDVSSAVLSSDHFRMEGQPHFSGDWSKYCAGRPGTNMTSLVDEGLRQYNQTHGDQ